MKKKIITLITTLTTLCLIACGSENTGENTNNVGVGSDQTVTGTVVTEPTAKPVVEATAESIVVSDSNVTDETADSASAEVPVIEPTEEPTVEATPEPTEAPSVVYEGIDMNSDLPGMLWIETFVGIIDEPKIVVYSNETGRKEIVEYEQEVIVNPDTDVIALYLPDGYKRLPGHAGLYSDTSVVNEEHSEVFLLNPEETRENGTKLAALYVEHDGEKIKLIFTIIPE